MVIPSRPLAAWCTMRLGTAWSRSIARIRRDAACAVSSGGRPGKVTQKGPRIFPTIRPA